jgi:glucosamine-6-phosphate deaminase
MEEVRTLLRLSPEEVIERAGDKLVVREDLDELHLKLAEEIAEEIATNNEEGEPTRLILPVGPTGQYEPLAEILNRDGISLENCWFFFMDEYSDEDGYAFPADHPLSFKGEARRLFLGRLDEDLGLHPERVVFPNEDNIRELEKMIDGIGGIDVCYGGIGIHGHVAFNEPEPRVHQLGPRRVRLNDFTVTINAVRDSVGGNLECFPRSAYTLGMRQILGARRIMLYPRNGCEFDWANTVCRLALFGEPDWDYPVTNIRGRNYVITTDRATLASPRNLI